MKSDPILEELWRIKDQLAAEAGYDAHRFIENLRRWEAEHLPSAGAIRNVEELRAWVAQEERRRAEASPMALREKPEQGDRSK